MDVTVEALAARLDVLEEAVLDRVKQVEGWIDRYSKKRTAWITQPDFKNVEKAEAVKFQSGVMYEPSDFCTIYTVEEVADILHVKQLRIIHTWIRKNQLRAKKVGRMWLITRAEIKRFVAPGENIDEPDDR